MGYVVQKSRINEFIDALKRKYRVIAPVKADKLLQFKEVSSSKEADLNDEITYKSAKEFYFPQNEKLLHFSENGDVSEESRALETIIFGVRPCDLEAIKIITAVFTKGRFTDTPFVNHLDNTILIGLGCLKEKPGCFCEDRSLSKENSVDCDIFLTDMGDYYLADVISDDGEKIIKDFLPGVESVEPAITESCKNEEKVLLELNTDEDTLFNKIDWESISETCIGCGTCTYICPTCHCFEFKDVAEKGGTTRYRCWDSCMYPKFTLHTSGHNPRPSKKERYRQRIMHKYLYVKENFGFIACTGCGRCIRSCPAGLNIKSVVKKIMGELK